jgi:hypothetical protein
MKEVLSLITLGIGALFFVVFFAALKPDVVSVATGPSKPGYCDTKASPTSARVDEPTRAQVLIKCARPWSPRLSSQPPPVGQVQFPAQA